MEHSTLYLVRIWPQAEGFHAAVRKASDERTHHFHQAADLARHLGQAATPVTVTAATTLTEEAPHAPRP